jgi:hypothetical protein
MLVFYFANPFTLGIWCAIFWMAYELMLRMGKTICFILYAVSAIFGVFRNMLFWKIFHSVDNGWLKWSVAPTAEAGGLDQGTQQPGH